jgi:hypothetical protein
MNWKTAMQVVRGIFSGVGIIAGIAAIARSAAFGETLARYQAAAAGPELYSGIQSQAAQAVSDALGAGLVFYDSVRLLLLFGGIAMICLFGILLAETMKGIPVDVLVDSQGMDTFRRRAAHAASRLASRLDPEEEPRVVHRQEILPDGDRDPIEFATVETAPREEPGEDRR